MDPSGSKDVLFPDKLHCDIHVSDDLYASPNFPRMGTTSRSLRHRPGNCVCSADVPVRSGAKLSNFSTNLAVGTRPPETFLSVRQVPAHGRMPADFSPQRVPTCTLSASVVKSPAGGPATRPLDTLHAVSRRRTWSPPTLPRTRNSTGQSSVASPHNFRPIRSYRSNDQLDIVESEEDATWTCPPYQKDNFHIIRPIACKPAQNNFSPACVGSPDDGYASQENTVRMGVVNQTYTEATPSPSDSGLGELELMIREKDAEASQLRETMEQNEGAIIQVYMEKDQNWQAYLQSVITEWQKRLQHHQQHAHKMEQALLKQIVKFQSEKRSMQQELEVCQMEKKQSAVTVVQLQSMCEKLTVQCNEAEHQKTNLQTQLEESRWELCQRSGEISLLKTQLRDCKEEATHKTSDLLGTRAMLKDVTSIQENKDLELIKLRAELDMVWQEAQSLRSSIQNDLGNETSSFGKNGITKSPNDRQFGMLAREMRELQLAHDVERGQWLEEKNKVILYQERLQLNYVQMLRKNKLLEVELEQLMLELEAHESKDPRK